MDSTLSGDTVLQQLIHWAEARTDIRAMILTSTRTMPGAKLDPFSDYDVIVAVTDVTPYFEDRLWLEGFGRVLAVYQDPIRQTNGYNSFAYITQYEADRLKIDFTVIQAEWIPAIAKSPTLPDDLDLGYAVLLDKDKLTVEWPQPTHTAYRPQRPTEAEYLTQIEVFLHEATYVAKHLWRDDLLPAKFCLDNMMKQVNLKIMLEWQMGIDTDWSVKTGALGKGLKKYAAPDVWAALENTYAGGTLAGNWEAMFKTITLFERVARKVGTHLGFTYPQEMHNRAVAYLRGVQTLEK